jgi:hypothetical protein
MLGVVLLTSAKPEEIGNRCGRSASARVIPKERGNYYEEDCGCYSGRGRDIY